MLLDQLFGPPLPKVLKIVRRNGKMETKAVPAPLSEPKGKIVKPLFPAREIKNEKS